MQKCFVNCQVLVLSPVPHAHLGPGSEPQWLLWVPGLLLSRQVADDLVSPDALSTIREMDVANFRRVPRLPIYGMAQPSAKVTTLGAHLWGRGRVIEPFR